MERKQTTTTINKNVYELSEQSKCGKVLCIQCIFGMSFLIRSLFLLPRVLCTVHTREKGTKTPNIVSNTIDIRWR